MRKTLASLLAALMLLTLGAGTVTATGNPNTSLNACTNEAEGYYGGVKVYARDKAKGPSRVMCPATEVFVLCGPPDCDPAVTYRDADMGDTNLNRRNQRRPPLENIWNGFHKNIESFRLRAAAGCETVVSLWVGRFRSALVVRRLVNHHGAEPKTRLHEIPPRWDNKATTVNVVVYCPPDEPAA
jgi:hypothetical protein